MSKRILVFYPTTLIPPIMMSQQRALTQINALAKDHTVSVATIVNNNSEVEKANEHFINLGIPFFPVFSINKYDNWIQRKLKGLYYLIFNFFTNSGIPYLKCSSDKVVKNIVELIENKYDIVISHYWEGSAFFKSLSNNIFKIIDTHYLVEENIELNNSGIYYTTNHWLEKKRNRKSIEIQKNIFGYANMLVLNSLKSYEIANSNYPGIVKYYCPNGQELTFFTEYSSSEYEQDTILFYGSLSGLQNIRAFQLFYRNVWPLIQIKKPNVKLIILGNSPPGWIKKLNGYQNITVTGFVKDVREYIGKAVCMILPMDIGVGFRGRVVEVMAQGVPVIGNHNALDSLFLKNEIDGAVVTDNFHEMVDYCIRLIEDKEYRKTLSVNAKEFIAKNYTIEATFGKFSNFLKNL